MNLRDLHSSEYFLQHHFSVLHQQLSASVADEVVESLSVVFLLNAAEKKEKEVRNYIQTWLSSMCSKENLEHEIEWELTFFFIHGELENPRRLECFEYISNSVWSSKGQIFGGFQFCALLNNLIIIFVVVVAINKPSTWSYNWLCLCKSSLKVPAAAAPCPTQSFSRITTAATAISALE